MSIPETPNDVAWEPLMAVSREDQVFVNWWMGEEGGEGRGDVACVVVW